MAEWLLIVSTAAFGFTASFSDESACRAMQAEFQARHNRNPYLIAECVPNNWH